MILLGVSTPGGEQLPLTFLAEVIPIIVYVVLALSLLTIPFFIQWVKRRWFVNIAFMILSCLFIYTNWAENQESHLQYDMITTPIKIGGKVYFKKVEYYGSDLRQIRSISFILNGKKDGIWVTYDTLGHIIEQKEYRNDSLIQILNR